MLAVNSTLSSTIRNTTRELSLPLLQKTLPHSPRQVLLLSALQNDLAQAHMIEAAAKLNERLPIQFIGLDDLCGQGSIDQLIENSWPHARKKELDQEYSKFARLDGYDNFFGLEEAIRPKLFRSDEVLASATRFLRGMPSYINPEDSDLQRFKVIEHILRSSYPELARFPGNVPHESLPARFHDPGGGRLIKFAEDEFYSYAEAFTYEFFYPRMIHQRNVAWTERIDAKLNSRSGCAMVLVGFRHLFPITEDKNRCTPSATLSDTFKERGIGSIVIDPVAFTKSFWKDAGALGVQPPW